MYDIVLSQQQLAKANSGKFYGIDLGTSYTVVAEVDATNLCSSPDGNIPVKLCNIRQTSPRQFDGADISEMIASIVAVDDRNKMYVGNKLYPLKADVNFIKDHNIFYHWKLDLGVSKKPLYVTAIREDLDDASKVAGKILNYCRKSINGDNIWNNVVITVPASFHNAQRNDVINAARYANINIQDGMLFDEPTSAFLGYFNQLSLDNKNRFLQNESNKVLVIDFGGGTIDLSTIVVKKEDQLTIGIDNVAISRYNDLGGQDLDLIIAEKYLLNQISNNYGIETEDLDTLHQLMPQLAVMAEKLKKDLCCTIGALFDNPKKIEVSASMVATLQNQQVTINDQIFDIPKIVLTAEELQNVTSFIFQLDEYELCTTDKVVQSVPNVVNNVLEKSKWLLSDVNYVLLAGGSVRNPLFVKFIQQLLPSSKVLLPRNPDTLVAIGAAIKSFYKYGFGIELFKPICSDTIGVITSNTGFYPLIHSGCKLPTKVKLPAFGLQDDFQSNIEIPCCINTEYNIIAILKGELNDAVFRTDTFEIEMELSSNKTLTVGVNTNGRRLMEMIVENPVEKTCLSEEERKVLSMEEQIRRSQQNGVYRNAKQILRDLIWEYYYLGNYKRAIKSGEEYLKDFDGTDISVLNIIHCAYNELGQRKQAENYLDKALSLNPKNSCLVFNKSNIVERREGKQKALDYLLANNFYHAEDIKLRIALLSADLGDYSYAKRIKEHYDNGSLRPTEHFQSSLLKRVLQKLNTNPEYQEIADERTKRHVLSIDSDSLLVLKSGIVKQQ